MLASPAVAQTDAGALRVLVTDATQGIVPGATVDMVNAATNDRRTSVTDASGYASFVPVSRGGHDTWMNCITACRSCNGQKANRLPEEARMTLYYLPYVPSLHEDMILRGRRILSDQMEFLLASVPRHSRLHA